ncbi:hypothetical protein H112_00350 [Trichophyton rubrum D6]|uniref:Uncharacterized protein n=3 Tax=Trichophyton TaxID=5550 RepID=A0A080WQ21_TRIRC|nr:uncharacterized protein TERG_12669 [Trichophyton rubrum CBS 118892]EZF27671.1 hypothetical protein H100_00351 [Trichophyton rubrum MR850]EZF46651.1 hypothetical protein H102_00350 [Trichophyton rubrum CBS 100081]EZF57316.1 hypothetical protein H103_00349 [Trichophyton rubrum CBS 288.86]EZF68003.1 hypothetical protein H104_00349 [Trichophyton rubrum CBS 289.86]EZF78626.1 hypothetical protein H105_00345 [Trichophyton soudanense CBS 452.61]EZF89251.1 hypothetical protein H110_00353 [Trichophy
MLAHWDLLHFTSFLSCGRLKSIRHCILWSATSFNGMSKKNGYIKHPLKSVWLYISSLWFGSISMMMAGREQKLESLAHLMKVISHGLIIYRASKGYHIHLT